MSPLIPEKILRLRAHLSRLVQEAIERSERPAPQAGPGLPRRVQLKIVGTAAIAVVVVILLSLGVGAVRSFIASRSHPAPELAPGTFKPTPAQLATLSIQTVTAMTFRSEEETEGNIAIDDDLTTPVFSPYSGRVTKMFAKLGEVVSKGSPLVAMEASEFVQGQNDLITALAATDTARAQLNLAQTNEKRQHELYDAKAAALKDWQQSQVDLINARSGLHTAEIALAAVRNRLRILGKSEDEIRRLETADGAGRMNPEAVIYAPIAGTVIQRQVGLGQYIQSGTSTQIYTIGDLSTVWLIADVRETDAGHIRLGDPIEVRVPAYPGRVFKAKISYIAPAIDSNTHRLAVRADVENPDGALKPQMFASFSIITGRDERAPSVPDSAIVYDGDVARVWMAFADGSLGLRTIQTGRVNNHMVEVTHGVVLGDRVVTSGTLFIDRAATAG